MISFGREESMQKIGWVETHQTMNSPRKRVRELSISHCMLPVGKWNTITGGGSERFNHESLFSLSLHIWTVKELLTVIPIRS
jgi:hypothetical protein